MSKDILKKLFKSDAVDWTTRSLKFPVQEFSLFLKPHSLELDLALILPYASQNASAYNHIKGFLTEYYAADENGEILNAKDLQNKLHKYLFKLDLAPLKTKNQINQAIDEVSLLIKEKVPSGTKFLVVGGYDKLQQLEIKSQYNLPDSASQTDLFYFQNEIWHPFSLKTTKSKKPNFGLKNTSASYFLPDFSIKSKEIVAPFFQTYGIDSAKTSYPELKEFIKKNELQPLANSYAIETVYTTLIPQIISRINEYSPEDLYALLLKIIGAKLLPVWGCTKNGSYNYTLDVSEFLKFLYENKTLTYINGSTFCLGDKLLFRLKFSDGNLCSSMKLQLDIK